MTIWGNFGRTMCKRKAILLTCLALLSGAATRLQAQSSVNLANTTPVSWVQSAATNELRIIDEDGSFPARYTVHKVDERGDITRDVIESRDGSVARLVLRDGKPITAEEDAAERKRLEQMLESPSDFAKHHKKNSSARGYSSSLVKLMPEAMIYTYAPGQPQPAGASSSQVVIDFKPDPKFKPPSMIADLLTGIEGRLWIDAKAHVLTRAEARVVHPVDFGWGVLARIYAGGTIEFEQSPIGNSNYWIYSRVDQNLRIREVMVKVAQHKGVMTASNLRLLPNNLSYQEAIHKLLDTPLPTH